MLSSESSDRRGAIKKHSRRGQRSSQVASPFLHPHVVVLALRLREPRDVEARAGKILPGARICPVSGAISNKKYMAAWNTHVAVARQLISE
jgi:hypothetical protein